MVLQDLALSGYIQEDNVDFWSEISKSTM